MSSNESVEPRGFFKLPRELRDKIVSLKGVSQGSIRVSLADLSSSAGQYNILYQLQDEVEFGVDHQLVIRFPLPRLHHISRLFTVECDSRAPARPLVVVSQRHRDFQWVNGRKDVEQFKCPRIVNLRRKRMQKRHLIRKLHIDFYACNATDGDARNSLNLFNSMFNAIHNRFAWAKAFVQSMRSLSDDAEIHVRLMLNEVEDIEMVRMSRNLRSLWRRGPAAGKFEIIVDCPGEHEYHEDEFTRAKTLALWSSKSGWWFDEQEIRRCQALAELRSDWSTAATSPQSSQGKDIGEIPEFVDEDLPVSPLTAQVTKISWGL